jgi:hypothetical protein
MVANGALNVVPPLRAQSAELAQADSGARKCGIKLRLPHVLERSNIVDASYRLLPELCYAF